MTAETRDSPALGALRRIRLDGRAVQVALALVAGICHFLAMPVFFFIRDFRSLDWAQVGWPLLKVDLGILVFDWEGYERPIALVKAHFIVALKIFGAWFPGHAVLATLPHVACTIAVFHLARRLTSSVHVAVAPVVALLFAIAPGSGILTWPSTIHHVYATLGVLLLALAYLRYADTGSKWSLVGVLLAAALVYVANESAVVTLLVPLALEAARGGVTGTRRSRWLVAGFCALAACVRFFSVFGWSALSDRLRGKVWLYPESPVYSIDPDPLTLVQDIWRCIEVGLGVPLAVVIMLLVFSLWFAREGRAGPAIRVGLLFSIIMALPLASHWRSPREWDGYECIAGFLIAVVTAVFSSITREDHMRAVRLRIVAGVFVVLAVSAALIKHRTAALFYGDVPAQMRAVYEGLRATLPRGHTGTIVLYGIPAQRNRSNYPTMMDRFWPGLLPDIVVPQIVVVVPYAAEEIEHGQAVWVRSLDSPLVRLVEPVRRFRLTGGGARVPDKRHPPPTGKPRSLVPCRGAECVVTEE